MIAGMSGSSAKFYVHIDGKARLEDFTSMLPESDTVVYARERVKITWGGFNMCVATLKLLEAAARTGQHSHYVLLSGSDYPIRSEDDLLNLLRPDDAEFIGMNRMPVPSIPMSRLESYYIATPYYATLAMRLLNRATHLLPKRDVKRGLCGLQPYCGLSWWCLTDACVRYILDFVHSHPSFVEFFHGTKCGDEFFFHTLVGSSPYMQRVKNNITFVIGGREGTLHPARFNRGDIEAMRTSGKYFARKFDYRRDPELYDLVDHELRGHEMPGQDSAVSQSGTPAHNGTFR